MIDEPVSLFLELFSQCNRNNNQAREIPLYRCAIRRKIGVKAVNLGRDREIVWIVLLAVLFWIAFWKHDQVLDWLDKTSKNISDEFHRR